MIIRTIAGVVIISSRLVYDRLAEGYLCVLEGSGGALQLWPGSRWVYYKGRRGVL